MFLAPIRTTNVKLLETWPRISGTEIFEIGSELGEVTEKFVQPKRDADSHHRKTQFAGVKSIFIEIFNSVRLY